MKALGILNQQLRDETLWLDSHDEAIKELEVIQDIMLEKDEALDVERLLFKNKLEEFRTMQKDFSRLKLLFDSEFCRCSKCGEYKRSGFGCYCENEY